VTVTIWSSHPCVVPYHVSMVGLCDQ
jgi:hypothetical protein